MQRSLVELHFKFLIAGGFSPLNSYNADPTAVELLHQTADHNSYNADPTAVELLHQTAVHNSYNADPTAVELLHQTAVHKRVSCCCLTV
jgi:hypothetical protein